MYEPVVGLSPILVNHDVNMRGATGVETRVDGGHFHNTTRISVPTTTEPGLRAVERIGVVSAIEASCIGWWKNSGHKWFAVKVYKGAYRARSRQKSCSSRCSW